MSDMRLIVAGAGGRMGRTLVKAIAQTPGSSRRRDGESKFCRSSARMRANSPGSAATALY